MDVKPSNDTFLLITKYIDKNIKSHVWVERKENEYLITTKGGGNVEWWDLTKNRQSNIISKL